MRNNHYLLAGKRFLPERPRLVAGVIGLMVLGLAFGSCATPKPSPPPVRPTTDRTIAVHVLGTSGELAGALVQLEGSPEWAKGVTNQSGYLAWQISESWGPSIVHVQAVGYQNYDVSVVLPQPPACARPCNRQLPDIQLTPTIPFFTREQVGVMRASWQGCTYHLATGDMPAWLILGLSDADRAQAYTDEKACGNTHVFLNLSGAYREPGTLLPPLGYDYTSDLQTWKARIEEALALGFIPVLPLACDGHSPAGGGYSDPVGQTYGKEWCLANLARILGYLADGDDHVDLSPANGRHRVALMAGYELINNGGYSPQDWIDIHRAMRMVPKWSEAFIFGEIGGYTWGGDANPSYPNGPIGWWNGPGGQDIDGIIEEFNSPYASDVRTDYEQVAAAHVVEHANGETAPCLAAGIKPENCIAYELTAHGTSRGPWFVVAGEIASFDWVRRGASMIELLTRKRQELAALGFPVVD